MAQFTFGGVSIVRPGVYSQTDVSEMVPPNAAATGLIGAVGPAKGGDPNQVYLFNSLAEARAELKEGELLDAIELMYSPGLPGANMIYAKRVVGAGADQADLEYDAKLEFTAKDYGDIGNSTSIFVEAGTEVGKKVSVRNFYTDVIETYDNLGPLFTVNYDGEEDYAELAINVTDGNAVSITGSAGNDEPNKVTVFQFDLTTESYNTVQKVISGINAQAGFNAVQSPHCPSTSINSRWIGFPAAAATVVLDEGGEEPTAATVVSELGTIVYTLNRDSNLVTVDRMGIAVEAPENTTNWVALTGGSDGATPDASAYTTAMADFTNLETDIVYAASGEADIRSAVLSHVNSASSVIGRKERIGVVGLSDADADVSDYTAAAIALNSERMILCAPGIVRTLGGVRRNLPSYYTAAVAAGILAGQGINQPLTYRQVGAEGLTRTLTSGDINALIQGGVSTVEYDLRRGFRFVKGVTTWLVDDNIAKVEPSCVRIVDTISKELRTTLEDRFIGRPFVSGIEGEITAVTSMVLDRFVARRAIVAGDTGGAYRNINVELSNGAAIVSFEVSPAIPMNYIFVRQRVVPPYSWTTADIG